MATYPSIKGVPVESGMEITFVADFLAWGDVRGEGLVQLEKEHWIVYNNIYWDENRNEEFSEYKYIEYLHQSSNDKNITLSPFKDVKIKKRFAFYLKKNIIKLLYK